MITESQDEEKRNVESEYVSIIVYQEAQNEAQVANGFGQSLNIVIPQGNGLNLFKRLVYSGCKPLGYNEYLSIMLEANQPVFPEDFPNTQIGC